MIHLMCIKNVDMILRIIFVTMNTILIVLSIKNVDMILRIIFVTMNTILIVRLLCVVLQRLDDTITNEQRHDVKNPLYAFFVATNF